MKNLILLTIFSITLSWNVTYGQACSCAGAPLLSALELPATQKGTLQLSLTYEYSSISDVYSGSEKISDDTRSRIVHSALLEINYGLTDKITLSSLLTFLQQERTTASRIGTGEFLQTRGIGDGVLLIKYNIVPLSPYSQRQITLAGGIKLPFGKSSLETNKTLIAADMQPGTGSWDGVLWGYISQGLYRIAPVSLYSTFSYRFTGTNNRFGENLSGYQFGKEFMMTFGINSEWNKILSSSVSWRYRATSADKFASVEVPNTGGKWLNIEPAIDFNLINSLALRAMAQIPVYRKLEGTQLTTSYNVNFSLFYTISKSKSTLKI